MESLPLSGEKDDNFIGGMHAMIESYAVIIDEKTGEVLREFNAR